MGGTRCYFRQCHVGSAKFPRMHFFRFPLKESERYKKWRQFSKMEKILKFPEMRRRNTSVCGRHFRLECFMNYKMDRLTPNAIPTIMKLSDDKALDFELDIENGVLITLEKAKFKHLIPPDNFECPLYLTNDQILLSILNGYSSNSNLTHTDYVELDKSVGYEDVTVEKPEKSLSNCVEILETIQVAAPRLKRVPRLKRATEEEESTTSSASINKKRKILNPTYCEGRNGSLNELNHMFAPRSIQNCEVNSDEIGLVETEQVELVNIEQQLLLTDEVYNDGESEGTEDIEIFEVHKQEISSHYELPINDTDTTIVELKSDNQFYYADRANPEISKIQSFETDLQKKIEDFDALQVKLSLLKAENYELKKMCKENVDANKKLLLLQIENNKIKKTFKELNTLNDKLQSCYEENRQLKEKAATVETLKCDVLSSKEETKELKKLLESLKSKEQAHNLSRTELEGQLNVVKGNLELSQQQLHDTNIELNEIKSNLSGMKIENDRLSQHKKNLEQSLQNIQNSFDIKQKDYNILKIDFDNLQKENNILEAKYWKLQASKNQEPTVSTSNKEENIQNPPLSAIQSIISANSFSKAQLFNGIKRYLCASMVSLLRMEMFGNSEREWKSDERLVAVNILGLGEEVYKYFTDEWRIRLPALRDVRNWLNQSQMEDVEEDL